MTRVAVALSLLLAACSATPVASDDDDAGRALESAARRAGIAGDMADAGGVYAAGDDRLCLVGSAARYRVGVNVDFGDGQRCIARGVARGRDALAIDLGNGCLFTATRNGDRLLFPPRSPPACARACQGRATLDALVLDRLSEAGGEAERLRGGDGKLLCDN
ncbi:hypothetical protein [Sphingomonas sp. 8AM]|uniref:hypothetical protein n=1 Tax=Sphingomonas sp. 8AM TaxID=2653170 RepID=UPI0012F02B27|nr:hypothetical protein [Sphingomonas sp. 8AM]VXD03096.1 conserved exported hypothetical protein [Sphingomonas sp. 8AM]